MREVASGIIFILVDYVDHPHLLQLHLGVTAAPQTGTVTSCAIATVAVPLNLLV